MNILPRVCAEFRDRRGNVVHTIHPEDLKVYQDVPDAVQEDPLFRMLLADGSILLPPKDTKERKNLENDPMAGATADGKKVKEPAVETEADAGKPAKAGKTAKADQAEPVKSENGAEVKPSAK